MPPEDAALEVPALAAELREPPHADVAVELVATPDVRVLSGALELLRALVLLGALEADAVAALVEAVGSEDAAHADDEECVIRNDDALALSGAAALEDPPADCCGTQKPSVQPSPRAQSAELLQRMRQTPSTSLSRSRLHVVARGHPNNATTTTAPRKASVVCRMLASRCALLPGLDRIEPPTGQSSRPQAGL